MTGIGGPIQGEAQRLGLTSDATTGSTAAGREERARLDEEELRALEATEYYGDAEATPPPPPVGLVDRLKRWLRGAR